MRKGTGLLTTRISSLKKTQIPMLGWFRRVNVMRLLLRWIPLLQRYYIYMHMQYHALIDRHVVTMHKLNVLLRSEQEI